MKKLFTALVALSLIGIAGLSQSTTPTTTNAGGGSYSDPSSYFRYLDWSIGELTLIHTVAPGDSSFVLYQGVLQPCTEKPGFSPVSANFLAGDFTIMPNPTTGKFEINFFVRENGQMDLELVNMMGQTMEKRSFRYNGCCRIEKYDISHLPAGVYMIAATLTPDPFTGLNLKQVVRQSGLKLVKLR
jgi:Secretion system C-terminal sorting domain